MGDQQVTAAIECFDLTKTYVRHVTALHNITLHIAKGSSFGLLGENGAGKSTLVRILLGFIHPTSGIVRVLGEDDITCAHDRLGYVHERPIFELRFSGYAYLQYMAQLSGIWGEANHTRVQEVLAMVQLQEAASRPIHTYSKGMQQRLAIAQALITEPELLILDEPTSGLDPRSQWEIRQIILNLRKLGKTLLLCSHYLAEVEELCDAVGILRRGQMLLSGTVSQLLAAQGCIEIVLGTTIPAETVARNLNLEASLIEAQGNKLCIKDSMQQSVLAALIAADIPIISLNPLNHTLEEIYLQTTYTKDNAQQSIAATRR
jgi:ABC-2 type transport system ATP-binding protein